MLRNFVSAKSLVVVSLRLRLKRSELLRLTAKSLCNFLKVTASSGPF